MPQYTQIEVEDRDDDAAGDATPTGDPEDRLRPERVDWVELVGSSKPIGPQLPLTS